MTTQAALQGEDELLEAGVEVDVVPTPEGLGRLCGIALEVPEDRVDEAVGVLGSAGVPFDLYEPARRETAGEVDASR